MKKILIFIYLLKMFLFNDKIVLVIILFCLKLIGMKFGILMKKWIFVLLKWCIFINKKNYEMESFSNLFFYVLYFRVLLNLIWVRIVRCGCFNYYLIVIWSWILWINCWFWWGNCWGWFFYCKSVNYW